MAAGGVHPQVETDGAAGQAQEEKRRQDDRSLPNQVPPKLHDFLLRQARRSSECQHEPCQLRPQGDQGLARKLIVRFRTVDVREWPSWGIRNSISAS